MATKTISIIGCGWLGFPLATRLLQLDYVVKGSATTTEKVALLRQKGIDAHQLLLNPASVGDSAYLLQADTIVINIPPKAGKMGDDFHPQQVQWLTEAIKQSTARHVIYVSSTSVYPEQIQESIPRLLVEELVIDESQSAAPALVRAEQLVLHLEPERNVTVLRCGGLMGYGRIPGKYVTGRTVDTGAVPVNYLHRDDAVEILLRLIAQPMDGTFNVVAPQHPTRETIYRKSCADFGYELPTFIEPAKPVPYKVISPEKLIEAINYGFLYPNPLLFPYGDEESGPSSGLAR